ncbi:DUF4307 domain-containing protein [Marinactinospora thermotolerans]|uniref:DUF4307 domain-containing protein n=1 Tax=Marinactinospora thermotolerans DSM 45154 TaxID=1122192 RepID=A0A1T4SZ25_9ACTN|nr:DUF4307 domain-containing protein [Marinactinospora thermotolerans]SKA33178.1 protein of unknown function [Marinactinospora thermotolerans DSM 45154]
MQPKPSDHASDADGPAPAPRRRLGNRPVFFVLAVLAAAIFTVGWGTALLGYSGTLNQAHYQTIAWKVDSATEASITFQVNARNPTLCLITATDAQHVQVGQTEVAVEAGLRDVRATVETVREATSIQVASCREQEPAEASGE